MLKLAGFKELAGDLGLLETEKQREWIMKVVYTGAISELLQSSVSKRGYAQSVDTIHYHKKGFALGLGLKVRVLELGSGRF